MCTSPSISAAFNREAPTACSTCRACTMDSESLRRLLGEVSAGRVAPDAALERLRSLPYADLGFAKVDLHRSLRTGVPEAVYCPGKTPEQVVAIVRRPAAEHPNVLATRADERVAAAVTAAGLPHRYEARARLLIVRPEPVEGIGLSV